LLIMALRKRRSLLFPITRSTDVTVRLPRR
jgi:hypothetical protein